MLKKVVSAVALGTMVFASGAFAANMMFNDVPAGHWAEAGINWAADAGLMKGDGTNFRPGDSVNRAELAVVMQRFNDYLNGDLVTMSDYDVVVKNTSDYTLSPGLVVVHKATASLDYAGMVVGDTAPASVEALAEGGASADLKAALEAMDDVVAVYDFGPVVAGASGTVAVSVDSGMTDLVVSVVSMVVQSNDGYVYASGPLATWDAAKVATNLDAGTEANMDLGLGCAGGQPAADCTADQMGTAEDPYMAVASHLQLTGNVAEVSVMAK